VTDEQLEHEDVVIGRALHAHDAFDLDVSIDREVLEYHEVLGYLPFEEIAPPTGLESRVLDAARASRRPAVPSLTSSRSRKARRVVAVGAAAAVAAAVSLAIVNDSPTAQSVPEIEAVRAVDDAEVTALVDSDGAEEFVVEGGGVSARVVIASGKGAVYETTLPASGKPYRLTLTGPGGEAEFEDPISAGFLFDVEGEVTGATIEDSSGAVVATGQLSD
jgi:hypothetical protein